MPGHEPWLKIAQEDLMVAKELLPQEFFSPITYHCQQSAEKSFKAYLVFKDYQVVKTHDLTQLLELCITFEPEFSKIYESARLLNPFSTKFRYPSEYDIPDLACAQRTINHAQKILDFVERQINKPDTGQLKLL